LKTALIHDWLTTDGGSEQVLRAMRSCYPAPIYTLFDTLGWDDVHTSFLQRFPKRLAFPLYPLAIESFDLSEYDCILSSSHAVAKGVITRADQCHICYCHTPPRYLWDLHNEYKTPVFIKPFLHRWRLWDVLSSNRVDHFIANSHTVARRIAKTYRREATVIHPPVRTDFFTPEGERDDYYVTAGRLVPYKHVDKMVRAFAQLPRKRLVIVGDGPEARKLRKIATPNVEFTGRVSDEAFRDYLRCARAFLFLAFEDFGITPIEAMACGTPVIAYARGGALETVTEKSGIFLKSREVGTVVEAINHFETKEFDHEHICASAQQFSEKRFCHALSEYVQMRR